VPGHVAKQHPEWLLSNGATITLDPGIPAVRNYIMSVISDITQRYDVDGIHFDDYFYPPAPFNDDATYANDPRGFPATTTGRADWRRDNINMFIQELYSKLATIKPWVKFGVSPSGIYRSSTNPAIGSNTSAGASQHYSAVYADTKKWLQEGWVDYLAPQLYWYIGQPGSDYKILVPWWNDQVTNGRHIYIGQAIYKVNDPAQGAPWADRSQIPNQMRMNRDAAYQNVYGEIHFRTAFLRSNPLNVRDSIRLNIYKRPALIPTMPWKDNTPPQAPSSLVAVKQPDNSYFLNWTKPATTANELDKVRQFVVYRSESPAININDTANILTITPTDVDTYTDNTALVDKTYYYTVTSVDRLYNESAPSNVTDYLPPTITCPENQMIVLNSSCTAALPDYTRLATVTDDVTPSENIAVAQSPAAGTVINGVGNTTITLTATDASGKTAECPFVVKAEDIEAPLITDVYTNPAVLFPPNHKMRDVEVFYKVADNCGTVTTVLSVTSNEALLRDREEDEPGSDFQVLDNHRVKLRAARAGGGNGRVYTITITATDASGNISTETVKVLVPHDNSAHLTSGKEKGSNKKLDLKVMPNPSSSQFTIITNSPTDQSLQIRVTDNLNRLVEIKTGVSANGTISIGSNYKPGIYFMEVIQGTAVSTVKLIKE
jgi:hypothetical protein